MSELIKNSIHRVQAEGYTSDGLGVGRIDGQVIFVPGMLRGEICDVKVVKAGKRLNYGILSAIIEPSPERVKPECPVFGKCGGCGLMHMSYTEELEMKRQKVEDSIRRIGGADIYVKEIIGADSVKNYRNKVIFNLGVDKGKTVCGFYRKRSHDIIKISDCAISSETASAASEAVLAWMSQCGVRAYDEKSETGEIRHIYVRHGYNSGETLVCIVAACDSLKNEEVLIEKLLRKCPSLTGVVLNINKDTGNTVLKGSFKTLWGRGYIEDTLCNLRFKLSPMSFYQINTYQAEKLYKKTVEFAKLNRDSKVIDLYCGTGTITLCLAQKAGQAVGAEIVPEAIKDAEKNALRNNIKNVRFITGDAFYAADMLRKENFKPDVVVVDPPRKGLAADVIAAIAEMAPDRVVYVSCDPGTLGRDIKIFSELGFSAKKAVAVDMFPRTPHVETCVLLGRKIVNDKNVEYMHVDYEPEDAEYLRGIKGSATYAEIKEWIKEQYNVSVSSLYIAQCKDACGFEKRQNFNTGAEGHRVPNCPEKKKKLIMKAFEHFRMI